MLFVDNNGNYPKFISEIQEIIPGWQPGDNLPAGWHQVLDGELPVLAENQVHQEVQPTLNEDGVYVRTYTVRDLTEQELEVRNAPTSVREKLAGLGFSNAEIRLILR